MLQPTSTLRTILLNHAIGEVYFRADKYHCRNRGGTLTYSPFKRSFYYKSSGITTPANMVIPDIQCSNGVVHIIDKVLLP
jgi:uncharacterized surface protein with fasciclin (FAS1) repeats